MKKLLNIPILAIAIFSILNACNVTRNTSATALPLPDTFRYATTTDTGSVASMNWKDFFTDTQLLALIDTAIARNYDMQVALNNIEAAQLTLKQLKNAYLPDVRLQVTANSTRPSDNSLNGLSASQFLGTTHVEDFTAGVGLAWEADIWRKIKNQKAAALAAFLQTNEARKAIQTNIVANLAKGYFNLQMLDEQLRIARKNVLLNDSTLRIIRLQYNAGEVTLAGVEQAEAQKMAAQQLIPMLEQQIAIRENALSVLSGKLPGSIARNSLPAEKAFGAPVTAGVPATLLARRPDVKSQELALAIANARTGIARANMYPSLSITASGGLNAFKASNWFNMPASLFGMVAGGLTQPLFQKKQLRTQYELALIERENTVIRFRNTVLNAVGEVSDVLVQLQKLKEQEAIMQQRTATLQRAISNSTMLFANGKASYLEVITAQANVLQSELDLVAVKTANLNAGVELYRSLGGGWN
ncbi:MAG: efflux transporter outer membrane subunit [Chitinophagaceae bacterium]